MKRHQKAQSAAPNWRPVNKNPARKAASEKIWKPTTPKTKKND